MNHQQRGITRRQLLKRGAIAGLTAALGNSFVRATYAASKDRVTILSSISLDSLNPYAISASIHYGIWQHMIEPLVEVSYTRPSISECLPNRGNFREKNGFCT